MLCKFLNSDIYYIAKPVKSKIIITEDRPYLITEYNIPIYANDKYIYTDHKE